MHTLKQELSMIDEVIPVGSKILYVDYPIHFNIGDLLIMMGTEKFFSDRKYSIVGRYSVYGVPIKRKYNPFSSLPKLDEDVVIVLHGGGNFGDIYPFHQYIRELIVRGYPRNRIVVLPQTIHFDAEENMARAAKAFQQHADLHIYVRDRHSMMLAQEKMGLRNVRLCPDMAHFLWDIYPNVGGKGDSVLWLLRRDVEKIALPASLAAEGVSSMDWDDLIVPEDEERRMKIVKMERFNKLLTRQIFPANQHWLVQAEQIIDRAINLFQSHGKVVTSRLHGHIFASLLGIENVLLDNSYGKNSTYYNTWTHRVSYSSLYS